MGILLLRQTQWHIQKEGMMSEKSQIQTIARRMTRWARSVEKNYGVAKSCGYCMSGWYGDFYQDFFFPQKQLHLDRLNVLIGRLHHFGIRASLDVVPFENGTGMHMHMRMAFIR
jgi:hypothetical protein